MFDCPAGSLLLLSGTEVWASVIASLSGTILRPMIAWKKSPLDGILGSRAPAKAISDYSGFIAA